eukprot:IDg5448t1
MILPLSFRVPRHSASTPTSRSDHHQGNSACVTDTEGRQAIIKNAICVHC